MVERNLHSDPGALIPEIVKENKELEKMKLVETKLPMTAWSDGQSWSSSTLRLTICRSRGGLTTQTRCSRRLAS